MPEEAPVMRIVLPSRRRAMAEDMFLVRLRVDVNDRKGEVDVERDGDLKSR